jgi:hypothetical protein
MIGQADAVLRLAGYDTSLFRVLIRASLPAGYRAMTLEDGAVLGEEAFTSQAMVNHVLEEELLHLRQKPQRGEQFFGPGTARALEEEINERRRFPLPPS